MSNHQADDLFVETLGRSFEGRTFLALKPVSIKTRLIKDIDQGALIEGFDPYNPRIFRDGDIIARAKLGKTGDKEALYIVSTETENAERKSGAKESFLECRISFLPDMKYEEGKVIEFDEQLSSKLLILSDGVPVALGKIVDYDDEACVYITRKLV